MNINLRLYENFDEVGDELDIKLMMTIWQYDAFDPSTGAYMSSSRGRRKSGRPKKYWARIGEAIVRFTANSDHEALHKANKKLNAILQKARV